jgi:hypothetical protein
VSALVLVNAWTKSTASNCLVDPLGGIIVKHSEGTNGEGASAVVAIVEVDVSHEDACTTSVSTEDTPPVHIHRSTVPQR